MREEIVNALRELVGTIFQDCFGAYGTLYDGRYETLIQNLASVIEQCIELRMDMRRPK